MTSVLGQEHCILSLCKLNSCNFHSSEEILDSKKTGLLLPKTDQLIQFIPDKNRSY